jgi:hypothetical protein
LGNSSFLNASEDQGMVSADRLGNTLDFQGKSLGPDDIGINLDFDAEWPPINTGTPLFFAPFGKKSPERALSDKSKSLSKGEIE